MQDFAEYFIYLYVCGATSVRAEPPKISVDWQALLQLASQHAVGGVIAYALRQSDDTGCPQALREQFCAQTLGGTIHTRLLQDEALQTVAALEAAELHPVVLKGLDLARLYACAECRSSADNDLLIPPDEEQRALSLLQARGWAVTPRGESDNHSVCRAASGGVLELHTSLWNEAIAGALLVQRDTALLPLTQFDRASCRQSQFSVLQPDDGILYLALHTVKHFAVQGIGVRTACDLALYYAAHCSVIDLPAFWTRLAQLGFYDTIAAILQVMAHTGSFSLPKLPAVRERVVALMTQDIASYSTSGKPDASLQNELWVLFCNRTAQRADKALRRNAQKKRAAQRLRLVFPEAERLARFYPYLQRYPWLYPAAWLQRTVRVLVTPDRRRELRQLHDPTDTAHLTDAQRTRLALFEALDLAEKRG